MATRDFLSEDHSFESDCLSDDDSEYMPSSSDSGDAIQPSPRKKKRVITKQRDQEKPSCSHTLLEEDNQSEDDLPLARFRQIRNSHPPEYSDSDDDIPLVNFLHQTDNNPMSEEDLTEMLDTPMWAKINFQAPDTAFKGHDEQAPVKVKEPLEYFREFVTNEMIESISEQTNFYSVQKDGKPINSTKAEIDLFIGLFLRMGLLQANSLRAFWADETRYDKIADHISRNRFEKLASRLHFTDNTTVTEEQTRTNKVWKIAPWLDGLRNSLSNLPQEECSAVDEIMIPFKGRSGIKQFMRNKTHKWGFKMWGRAGASGQIYEFEVYQGASVEAGEEHSDLTKSSQVVMRMTSNVPLGQNFKVFADNYFTSLALVKALQMKDIFYVGTVRANRLKGLEVKGEKDLKARGRGSFDHSVEVNSGIVAVRWHDNRTVDLLSSYVGVEPIIEVQRYDKKRKTFIKVPCPAIVKEYNKFMGGLTSMTC